MNTQRLDRKALKQSAKDILAAARPQPSRVTLTYLLIITAVSIVVNVVTMLAAPPATGYYFNPVGVFLTILVLLFEIVLDFGYTRYALRLADRGETDGGELFSGFPETGRVILMNLIVVGFGVLWYLAVIAAAWVPMMIVFMISGISSYGLGQAAAGVFLTVIMVAFALAIAAVLLFLMVRYFLAIWVLADDESVSPLNAVRRSRKLLRGRNREAFVLSLSFFGWSLLAFGINLAIVYVGGKVIEVTGLWWLNAVFSTLGSLAPLPLLLWLTPYMNTTYGLYYRHCAPKAAETESVPLPDPQTPWRTGNE